MREVLRLGEQLTAKLAEETTIMIAERTMMRDVAAVRARELAAKREEEIARIDAWAERQKAVVRDVFAAMLAENELDLQKHEDAIRRLAGEAAGAAPTLTSAPPPGNVTRVRPRSPLAHAAE